MSPEFILAVVVIAWLSLLTWIIYRRNLHRPVSVQPASTDLYLGLVKFNSFSGTGGEQSFAMALLDSQKNGILLTSLHSRESTRLYAKNIFLGKADQELSLEEKQALQQAINR